MAMIFAPIKQGHGLSLRAPAHRGQDVRAISRAKELGRKGSLQIIRSVRLYAQANEMSAKLEVASAGRRRSMGLYWLANNPLN